MAPMWQALPLATGISLMEMHMYLLEKRCMPLVRLRTPSLSL